MNRPPTHSGKNPAAPRGAGNSAGAGSHALVGTMVILTIASLSFAARTSSHTRAYAAPAPAPTTTSASAQPATQPAHRENFSDRYAVIVERNIFLRDRSRPNSSRTTQPTTQQHSAPKIPEEEVWLSGVAVESEGFRAYAEDLSGSYRILKLAPGDPIARGKITAIEIDAVEYENRDGKRIWIAIGSDFTGKPAAVSTSSPSSYAGDAPTTSSSTQPAGDSNSAAASLEEKMRQRRAQELKK